MKQLTNIQRVQNYLVKVFKYINEEYLENEPIETPTITIQSTARAYGHCSVRKVWSNGTDAMHELNISADYLSRPIYEIVATMEHEMTHLLAMQRGIKDVSANGVYHNKKFRNLANEVFGLQIDHHEKYGWTITSPTDETINFCIKYQLEDIVLCRDSDLELGFNTPTSGNKTMIPKTPRHSSVRKYQCPCCKASCRATKEINIVCGDCNIPFELVKTY